jgi:hypothetical protein
MNIIQHIGISERNMQDLPTSVPILPFLPILPLNVLNSRKHKKLQNSNSSEN